MAAARGLPVRAAVAARAAFARSRSLTTCSAAGGAACRPFSRASLKSSPPQASTGFHGRSQGADIDINPHRALHVDIAHRRIARRRIGRRRIARRLQAHYHGGIRRPLPSPRHQMTQLARTARRIEARHRDDGDTRQIEFGDPVTRHSGVHDPPDAYAATFQQLREHCDTASSNGPRPDTQATERHRHRQDRLPARVSRIEGVRLASDRRSPPASNGSVPPSARGCRHHGVHPRPPASTPAGRRRRSSRALEDLHHVITVVQATARDARSAS